MSDDHVGRLFVGAVWAWFAIIISLAAQDAGYSTAVSYGIGFVAVPVGIVGVYLLGMLGIQILKHLSVWENGQ